MLSSPAILFLILVGGQGGAVCLFVLGMLVVLSHYVCGVFSSLFFFFFLSTVLVRLTYCIVVSMQLLEKAEFKQMKDASSANIYL